MSYQLSADLVLILHLAFVLFVLLGGLLLLRWPKLVWLHLAAVTWGGIIEFIGLVCPLTPLEVNLRRLGGQAGYEGDFVQHYITASLYPSGLTRKMQIGLGISVLVLNMLIYGYWIAHRRLARGATKKRSAFQNRSV
jgi:hypothetical protein